MPINHKEALQSVLSEHLVKGDAFLVDEMRTIQRDEPETMLAIRKAADVAYSMGGFSCKVAFIESAMTERIVARRIAGAIELESLFDPIQA